MTDITCTRCGTLAIDRPLNPLGTAEGLWGLCEECFEEFRYWFAGGDLQAYEATLNPGSPDCYYS